jgi:hypothetical protein
VIEGFLFRSESAEQLTIPWSSLPFGRRCGFLGLEDMAVFYDGQAKMLKWSKLFSGGENAYARTDSSIL